MILLSTALLLIAVSCGGGTEQTADEPSGGVQSTEASGAASESTADDGTEETKTEDSITTTTTTEAPEAEAPPGFDPQGDPLDGLDNPTVEEDVAGGDIANVAHVLAASGENCFVTDFYGDGETTSAEVGTYIVDVEVVDTGDSGFGIRTEFSRGETAGGTVRLGLLGPGRDKLEGAVVTLAWDDSDTLQTCVDSGDTNLDVANFTVSIYIFSADGDYWDRATGLGAS